MDENEAQQNNSGEEAELSKSIDENVSIDFEFDFRTKNSMEIIDFILMQLLTYNI